MAPMRVWLLTLACLTAAPTAWAQTQTSTTGLWDGLDSTPDITSGAQRTPRSAPSNATSDPRKNAQVIFQELEQTESATTSVQTSSVAESDLLMPGGPRLDAAPGGPRTDSPEPDAPPPLGPGDLQPQAPPPATQEIVQKPEIEPEWYGWQTMLVSIPSLAVVIAGLADSNTPLIYAGLVGFLFGPPSVHFAHDNVGEGLASFAMQAGAGPTVGLAGVYGSVIFDPDGDGDSTKAGFLVGMAIGALTAIAIDGFILAREDAGSAGAGMNFAASFDGETAKAGMSWTF